MENSNSEKTVIATLAGVAAGFLVGILIAPEKGSKTRKKITDTSNDYLEGIKTELNDIRKDINTKIETAREEAEEFGEESLEKAKEAANKVKESGN